MLRVQAFDRARDHFRGALGRHPSLIASLRALVDVLAPKAADGDDPWVWFQLGFVRDVLGDGADAERAYRSALQAGIAEPMAGFARAALARLAPSG